MSFKQTYIFNCSIALDLDQLNRILAVLGSPSQEDLNCILNDKVGVSFSFMVTFEQVVREL